MVKLTCWILAITLLCSWCWPLYGNYSLPQYSSIRVHTPDAGEIVLFLLNVAIGEFGKLLDKGYKCPVYCDVHHKHYYWENNEEKHEQKSNI